MSKTLRAKTRLPIVDSSDRTPTVKSTVTIALDGLRVSCLSLRFCPQARTITSTEAQSMIVATDDRVCEGRVGDGYQTLGV